MSRPPLAPKITDTLYDMYEDAKRVNALTSPDELLRKVSIIDAVNQRIQDQIRTANLSSRPDPFIKRRLENALQENITIKQSVQNSLSSLQSGDAIALRLQLDEKARLIASLQAELDNRSRVKDNEISRLSSEKSSLQQTIDSLRLNISERQTELDSLRKLSEKLPDSKRLQQQVSILEQELNQLKLSSSREAIQKQADITIKMEQIASLSSQLERCKQEATELSNKILKMASIREKIQERQRIEGEPIVPEPVDTSKLKNCEATLIQVSQEKELAYSQKALLEKQVSELSSKLISFTQEKDSNTRNVLRLEREIETYKQQIDELRSRERSELATLERERSVLSGNIELVKQQYEQQLSLLRKEKSSTQKLTEAISAKEQEISSLKQLQTQLKETKERELLDLQRQLSVQSEKRQELEGKISSMEQRMQKDRTDFNQRITQASSNLQEEQQKLITANLDRISKLEQSLEESSNDKNRCEEQLREAIQDKSTSQQRVETLERDLVQLQRQLQSKTGELESSRASLNTVEQRLTEAEKTAADTQREVARLQQDASAVMEKRQQDERQHANQIESLTNEMNNLQQTLRKRDEDISAIQISINSLQSELDRTEVEKKQLEEQNKSQIESLNTKSIELRQKETELLEKQSKLDQHLAELQSVKQQMSNYEQEKQTLIAENAKIQAEIAIAKAGDDKYVQEHIALKEAEHKQKESVLQSTVESLNRKVEELSSRLDLEKEVTQLNEAQEKKLAELKSEKNDADQALQTQKEIHAQQLQEKQQENQTLRESKAFMKTQLDNCESRLKEMIDSHQGELDRVREALKTLTEDKNRMSSQFEETIASIKSQIEDKDLRINELTLEKKAERESFETALAQVNEKLRLSEDLAKSLEQQIQQYTSSGYNSVEDIKRSIDEKEKEIKEAEVRLEQLRKDNTATIETLTTGLTEKITAIKDLEQRHQAELENQKTEHVKALAEMNLQHQTLGSSKNQLETELATLAEMNTASRKREDEAKAEIERLKEEVVSVKRAFEEEIRKKCPTALGDLTKLLFDGLEKAQVIDIQKHEIQMLQDNMIQAIDVYMKAVGNVIKISVDQQKFGLSGMKQYVIPVVYMFHAWKTMLRIPIVLRGGASDNIYLYDVPEKIVEDQLFLMIGTDAIKESYQSKKQGSKMKLDVLLYYLLVGLLKRIERDYKAEEYRGLINYIKTLLQYANNKLIEFTQSLSDLIIKIGDTVTEAHNKTSPIISFIRLSSKTPGDNSVRFPYTISQDRILHMKYSSQDIPFYQKNKLGGDYSLIPKTEVVYDGDYHFGPFSYIFPENKTNSDIVKNEVFTSNIENRLRDGEPVCIIGYGASGSGKTTTLVYADYMSTEDGKPVRIQQPGILILLANRLAQGDNSFNRCYVTIYELEADQKSAGKSGICRKFPSRSDQTINRSIRGSDGVIVTNTVSYSDCEEKNDYALEYQNREGKWESSSGEGLETQLIDYINVKRNIAPSPNNPQSSRSHVVAKLTFKNEDRETTLLVCDFAGVENRFNCDDPESLGIMGYPFLLEQERSLYLSNAIAFTNGLLQSLQLDQDFKDIFTPNFNVYSFNYADNSPLLLAKDAKGNLSPEKLQQALGACYVLYSRLATDNLGHMDYIQELDPGHKKGFNQWKLSRMIISYKDIETGSKFSALFKGLIFRDIFSKVTALPGYKFIETQYKAKVGSVSGDNFPLLVKMVWWFLTSYKDDTDPNRFPLIDAMVQSHISFEIRQTIEEEKTPDKVLPKSTIEKFMQQSICYKRVNEGVYINESLAQLRRFISDTIQSTRDKNSIAPFIDQCAPLQCNPYYRDCFGQTSYYDSSKKAFALKSPKEYGLLSKYIMDVPNSSKMTFCIINVVNLSKDANNPPKSPYINITPLQIEYEKLLPYLDQKDEYVLGMPSSDLHQTTSDVVRDTIRLVRETRGTEGILPPLELYAEQILSRNNKIRNIANMIDTINSFNAITTIGTLEFTDMMAKYAVNRVTCNTSTTKIIPIRNGSTYTSLSPPPSEERSEKGRNLRELRALGISSTAAGSISPVGVQTRTMTKASMTGPMFPGK